MWSVVFIVGAGGGRCFACFLVGGRSLSLEKVGGWCLNQYMVGRRWIMVGGLRTVVGGWSLVSY